VTCFRREPAADVYRLYEGLPQQGPGSDALTLEALRRLGPLPDAPRVLDLGCGSGRQTLALARALGGRVVAVDDHEPFLRELDARARAAGLSHVIETRLGDMGALDLEARARTWPGPRAPSTSSGSSAGCAPGGGGCGRAAWPRCRSARGSSNVPARRSARSGRGLPRDGHDRPQRREGARRRVRGDRRLPAAGLRLVDGYYTPLLARAEVLAAEARDHAALAEAIADVRREVELFERFGDTYGYVFYLLRRQPVSAGGDGRGLRAGAEAHLPPHGSGGGQRCRRLPCSPAGPRLLRRPRLLRLPRLSLQRDVPVLLRRVLVALGVQRRERGDQAAARGARLDHLVQEAAGRGHERVRQLLANSATFAARSAAGSGAASSSRL